MVRTRCRHTWGTLALEAVIDPKVVSERLGHSTISITLDTRSRSLEVICDLQPMMTG